MLNKLVGAVDAEFATLNKRVQGLEEQLTTLSAQQQQGTVTSPVEGAGLGKKLNRVGSAILRSLGKGNNGEGDMAADST